MEEQNFILSLLNSNLGPMTILSAIFAALFKNEIWAFVATKFLHRETTPTGPVESSKTEETLGQLVDLHTDVRNGVNNLEDSHARFETTVVKQTEILEKISDATIRIESKADSARR